MAPLLFLVGDHKVKSLWRKGKFDFIIFSIIFILFVQVHFLEMLKFLVLVVPSRSHFL
jgi:hypothetical protein